MSTFILSLGGIQFDRQASSSEELSAYISYWLMKVRKVPKKGKQNRVRACHYVRALLGDYALGSLLFGAAQISQMDKEDKK